MTLDRLIIGKRGTSLSLSLSPAYVAVRLARPLVRTPQFVRHANKECLIGKVEENVLNVSILQRASTAKDARMATLGP